MKVRDLMTSDVESANPFTSLAAAVESLWRKDCGILPVEGTDHRVVGVITDRDIAIALGTRHELATHLTVGEVMSRLVFTCQPDDEVGSAMTTMKAKKVRRLPVVDEHGTLVGILSLADIARAAVPGTPKGTELTQAQLAELLRVISQHPKHSAPILA